MTEFGTIFEAFVYFFFSGLAFHAAMHYPIWLMKGGHWIKTALDA
jgi:hypothetical protein